MFHDDFQEGWRAYVKKDYETAHRLWLPLGEQENSRAQFFMGFMYDFGFGVQKDDKETVKWYRLAAEQGYRFTELNTIIHDSANMNVPKQFKNWLD